MAEVLASGQLVQGPQVAAFERALAERLGWTEAIAVSSGTAALHLALIGMGAGPGDEVIVPAFGFPATANAVEHTGARAVPADVDPETFALTAESVLAAASERTVGVLPVHAFGIPAPMDALEALGAARGWWLVEDAACALGTDQGSPASWGSGRHPVCLSFHPRKVLTTGEGGVVGTNDPALAKRIRTLRNHGIGEGPLADGGARGWRRFDEAGFNYRMSDLEGALGRVQLSRLGAIVADRQRVARLYAEALAALPAVRLPRGYDLERQCIQSLVVELPASVSRDAISAALGAQGIETTIGGYALAEQPYYARRYALPPSGFPVAARFAARALTLPLYAEMDAAAVRRVNTTLGAALAAEAIRDAPAQ